MVYIYKRYSNILCYRNVLERQPHPTFGIIWIYFVDSVSADFRHEDLSEEPRLGMRHYITQEDLQNLQPEAKAQ